MGLSLLLFRMVVGGDAKRWCCTMTEPNEKHRLRDVKKVVTAHLHSVSTSDLLSFIQSTFLLVFFFAVFVFSFCHPLALAALFFFIVDSDLHTRSRNR